MVKADQIIEGVLSGVLALVFMQQITQSFNLTGAGWALITALVPLGIGIGVAKLAMKF